MSRTPVRQRLPSLAALVALHLTAYVAAANLAARRAEHRVWSTATGLDGLVPYWPWIWPCYWLTYPYVILAGGAALLRMPGPEFRRAVAAFAGMTVVGAAIHVAFPARAPWPEEPHPVQALYHGSAFVRPYATLPSMHVAFSTLTALLALDGERGPLVRLGYVLPPLLILLATVTLREHVILDGVTGVALALVTAAWWRAGRPSRAP